MKPRTAHKEKGSGGKELTQTKSDLKSTTKVKSLRVNFTYKFKKTIQH